MVALVALSQIDQEERMSGGPRDYFFGGRKMVNAHAKEPFYGVDRTRGRCLRLAGSTVKFTPQGSWAV
jgi:hypothetical protein